MSYIPSVEEAWEILQKYNKEAFHLEHAQTVSKVMGEFAREYDPDRVEFWKTVGMLHDIDFELYPEQHCTKANEMLQTAELKAREILKATGEYVEDAFRRTEEALGQALSEIRQTRSAFHQSAGGNGRQNPDVEL